MQLYTNSVQDRYGNALKGAQITVRTAAGALAVLFADNGATPATNPLIADATGEFRFYAANGRYTFTVSAQGLQSETIDAFELQDALELRASLIADASVVVQATQTAINNRYRGALAADPATRTDGTANQAGDEYFSTLANLLKRWNGATWQASDINTANLASPGGAAFVGTKASGAGTVQRTLAEMLNDTMLLKNYGIAANGVTDDWAGWTACFADYAMRTTVLAGAAGAGGTSSYSAPFFSTIGGKSLLSKPLVLPSYLNCDLSNMLFDRHPSWAEVAGTYLITSTSLYQADLGGLSFRGVSFALEIKNANIDQGHIRVSGVRFAGGDRAVRVQCRSSLVVLSDFKSDSVPHFLLNAECDRLTLRDGWISQGALTAAKDATITNHSLLILENVVGVPVPHTGAEVAWINNHAFIDIRGMRFGGEPGSCTAVNNFAPANVTYPVFPSGVALNNSETYSVDTQAGTQESCIIRLFDLPNVIVATGNRGFIDTTRFISWGSMANQASMLATYAVSKSVYNFRLQNNQGSNVGDLVPGLPANLRPLFMPTGKVALPISSTATNTVISDLSVIPLSGLVWDVVAKLNPASGGSSAYLSVFRGSIAAHVGFNGAAIVRRLLVTTLQSALGGPAFNSAITVTAVFLDAGVEKAEIPDSNQSATLRLRIAGFQTGGEGAGFSGYINDVSA